jgi:hypothetical protein
MDGPPSAPNGTAHQRVRAPVVLILFNRPDLTVRVLDRIRQVEPAALFVIGDGPRPDRPDDASLCEQARAAVGEVDWPCRVQTNFSDVNLGVRRRIASGMSWVFDQVDRAVVLEDDCLPDPTFFSFCDELLDRFEHEERVMMITGTNIGETWKPDAQSYHFARRGNTWGWASWRRAWRHYDPEMKAWEDAAVRRRIRRELGAEHFEALGGWMDRAWHQRRVWAVPWQLTTLSHSGLCVVPSANLVSNLGFRADGTMLTRFRPEIAELPTHPMRFPLKHPGAIEPDAGYDRRYLEIRHPTARFSPLRRWVRGWSRSLWIRRVKAGRR